jgi:hypothetical protein
MKRTFLVLLAAIGAALLIVVFKFGTIAPCGILRAQIRQEAVREGQFAQVLAAVVPDSLIDAMIANQYGELTPGRCIALMIAGPQQAAAPHAVPPDRLSPVPQRDGQGGTAIPQDAAAAVSKANNEAEAAIVECKRKRLSGELTTHVASAECSAPRIIEAFKKANYRYMDLVYLWTAKRRVWAEKIDIGTLTEAQAEAEFSQFLVQLHDEERQRDRGQR